MRLLFFIPSLECGGAERVCATLCNYWADRGWTLTLATFDDGSTPPFFPISSRIRHVHLGIQRRSEDVMHSMLNNVRRVKLLRAFVREERPERILSFMDSTNVLTLIAALGTDIPVVVSERTDPARNRIPAPWRVLRRLTYPKARKIVLQTEAAAASFPPSWSRMLAVVPNPVPKLGPSPPSDARSGGRRLIMSIGRLGKEKGFDLLIRAFASIAAQSPEWDLIIVGDGPERDALSEKIARFDLSHRVFLPGRDPDAMGALRRADLFVLSSRFEGFPNALCEAMACGLPVISFDCPSGPADIIENGVDGLLVPPEDVKALADAMAALAGDPERRRALGAAATAVADRFSVERIATEWERVLSEGAR